jgi:hypothetical protein
MKDLILNLDIFGHPFYFNFKNSTRYKTLLGALMGLASFVTCIILFIYFGQNFYNRENPFSSFSKSYDPNYFNYTLKPENFIYAFRIDDQDGNLVNRPDIFYLEPHYIVYKKTVNGSQKIVDRIMKYHRCLPEDVNFNSIYKVQNMKDWYCLDEINNTTGLVVGGMYDSDLIQYVKIRLFNCKRGSSIDPNYKVTCSKNITEINNLFNNYVYFSMILQNYFMDVNNYTDPFQVGFNNLYETVDTKITKKIYYYFKEGIIEDKKGWISDDETKLKLYGMDRVKTDFFSSGADLFDMEFYQANLYFDKIIETFNRRYMKLQELLANIGGVLKAITFVLAYIIGYYNDYYLYHYLINNYYFPDEMESRNSVQKLNIYNRESVKINTFINEENKPIPENIEPYLQEKQTLNDINNISHNISNNNLQATQNATHHLTNHMTNQLTNQLSNQMIQNITNNYIQPENCPSGDPKSHNKLNNFAYNFNIPKLKTRPTNSKRFKINIFKFLKYLICKCGTKKTEFEYYLKFYNEAHDKLDIEYLIRVLLSLEKRKITNESNLLLGKHLINSEK